MAIGDPLGNGEPQARALCAGIARVVGAIEPLKRVSCGFLVHADALEIAELFSTMMGLPVIETPVSYFNDSLLEVMKQNGRGTKGHIGFAVNDIDAAEKWFAERGLEVNEESRVLLPDGGTKLVYFKREFAGFAVHLCRE